MRRGYESEMPLTSRSGIAVALCALWLLSCAHSGPTSEGGQPALGARVVSCSAAGNGGSGYLTVEFGASPTTPSGVAHLLPALTLHAYTYRPSTSPPSQAVAVGGFPSGPGEINLPPSSTDATAIPTPPPEALIPVEGGAVPEDLIFHDILLAQADEITIEAGGLGALIGQSAATPLGRVTVKDVQREGSKIALLLQFDWAESLGDGTEFQPKGSLVSGLSVGGRNAVSPATSYVVGAGETQSLRFRMAQVNQAGPVQLVLGQFGILYIAETRVAHIAEACA